MSPAIRYVVDASVVAKLFLTEALSSEATWLLTQIKLDPQVELYVPDLFYIEVANILWKHVQRSGYPASQVPTDIANLSSLRLHSTPTQLLATDAVAIALSMSISAYDACYVALSERLNVPMVTADQALTRKLAGTAYQVQWLGNVTIPPAQSP